MNRRVFILGFDGATFDIMLPMIARGELPNLAAVIKNGGHAPLNSTILPHSAPAWTTFATGKNPGKHGIIGFTTIMPDSYKLTLVNGAHNRAKTLWEVLSDYGKRVIVMNIPMTYPPKAVNGLLVGGLDTPSTDSNYTHPQELREEILKIAPDYKINLHLGGYLHNNRRRRKAIDIMSSSIEARTKMVLHLMKKYPWEFFAVRYNSPDNVQHQFWSFYDKKHPQHDPDSPQVLKDAVYTIYKKLDGVVGQISSALEGSNTTLIIMSDHGAGPRIGDSIYLQEWLRNLGYLTKTGDEDKSQFVKYMDDAKYLLKEKALSLLLRTIPPELKNFLMKIYPAAASKTGTYLRFSSINWAQTKAFAGEVEGIRINLVGKYPQGTVVKEEYEALREAIIAEAKKIKDPRTGEVVFSRVLKREEAFSGDCLDKFPDIILKPQDKYNITPKFFRREQEAGNGFITRDQHWRKISGSHRPQGIFIISGADCKQGLSLPVIQIADVFPTVLYQLQQPLPQGLDGRVVEELFTEEFQRNNPPRFTSEGLETKDEQQASDYSDKEAGELIDHLKGLGYL